MNFKINLQPNMNQMCGESFYCLFVRKRFIFDACFKFSGNDYFNVFLCFVSQY